MLIITVVVNLFILFGVRNTLLFSMSFNRIYFPVYTEKYATSRKKLITTNLSLVKPYSPKFAFWICLILLSGNTMNAQKMGESKIHWFDAAYYKASFHRVINYSLRDSSIIRTTLVTGLRDSLFFLDQRGLVTKENGLVVDQLDTVNTTVRSMQGFIALNSSKISRVVFSENGEFGLFTTSGHKGLEGLRLTVFHFDAKILEIDLSYTRFFNSYNILIANDGTVRLMLLPTMPCSVKVGNKDSIQIPPERATYLSIAPTGKVIMSDIPIVNNQSVLDMWQSASGGVRIVLIDRDTGFYRPEMNFHKRKYELLRLDNDQVVTWSTLYVTDF